MRANAITPAGAMQELLAWSADLPMWQRDALRRLCQCDQLPEGDVEELEELCLRPHLVGGAPRGVEPEPIAAAHVRSHPSGHVIALKSISDVANVNALADGQRLTFRTEGLTLVYGGNGSGKSGYGRILKKACRARDPGERILPDAYAKPPNGPASARIAYCVDGVAKSTDWTDGSGTDAALSAVSVFDAACASVHVEEANDIAYMPAAVALLSRLADTCREVKRRIGLRQAALQASIPQSLAKPKCSPDSRVGKTIASLGPASNISTFEALSHLSEDESGRLSSLKAEFSVDPSKTIERLKGLRQRAKQLRVRVDSMAAQGDELARDRLASLVQQANRAAEAARVAATDEFRGDPLPGIGSDAWRVLWDSARAYSAQGAYPGLDFPVLGTGSRCVLCQQLLDEESAQRLHRFDDFVRADTQAKATAAQSELRACIGQVRRNQMSDREQREAVRLVREEMQAAEIGKELRSYLTTARWRMRELIRTASVCEVPPVSATPHAPLGRIDGLIVDLETRFNSAQSDRDSEARHQLETELVELDDRIWLGTVLDDVRADLERRQQLAVLASGIADCETRGISNKATSVAEGLVTTALRDRFSREVSQLGAGSLRAELVQAGTQYGVPKFQVRLVANPAANVGEILSEGEHKCVAIAAFLAELVTSEDRSAIVLDDPVCSLDEDHREQAAARLVEEARHRQVIVLTHDIVFVAKLAGQARSQQIEVHYQNVARGRDKAGFCTDDPPLRVRPALNAADALERHVRNVSGALDAGQVERWSREAGSIAGELRQLWERTVEEALSPVYSRFDTKVQTSGLVKTTVISEEDCRVMREAYGWCSVREHSEPLAFGSKPPAPAEFIDRIGELRRWLEDIKARQEAKA